MDASSLPSPLAASPAPAIKLRDEDIDVILLMEEVEKRPSLYNKSLKEYSDANLRKKYWTEISTAIILRFWSDLTEVEKNNACKLCSNKWKNLRISFARELRAQKETKSGQAAQKRRKYIYFDQLLFLLPTIEVRETSGNASAPSEDDNEIQKGHTPPTQNLPPPKRPHPKNTTQQNKQFEDKCLEMLEEKKKKSEVPT